MKEKSFDNQMKEVADRLEEALGQPLPDRSTEPEVRSSLEIAKVQMQIANRSAAVWRSLLEGLRGINQNLLDVASDSNPDWAVARYPPPMRSESNSLDAVCCALELIRRKLFRSDVAAAKWLASVADGLIDQKIAGSVLSLAKPGYQRNRGKHGKGSFRRRDLSLGVLDSHSAWAKYRELVVAGFCSEAFAAILLAAEYHLKDIETEPSVMPGGLEGFLDALGFYENEVAGYCSLIRDKGAKVARSAWGYGQKLEQ